ncbi:MAG TPA: DUF5691 domain-containing protein [Chryseolinea sp.]
MNAWESIVNNAMLGTTKLPLRAADLPEAITEQVEVSDTPDAEEDFLRFGSLVYQYRQSGCVPLNLRSAVTSAAEAELKPYCHASATAVLRTILSEEHHALLKLWLTQCELNHRCAEPECVPALLDISVSKKELRSLILSVCGKRGEWLGRLNPQWNFQASEADAQTVWQTGRAEERKNLLKSLRLQQPAAALELLQSSWDTEGANEKVSFLEILTTGLSENDLAWLEGLKEKGQKVNNAIQDLIKRIPASQPVQAYMAILKEGVNVKNSKALLGMLAKTTIEVNEKVTFPEQIFKSGIEKLSSDKNVSDAQYILVQLIASVPPSFWNDHLKETPEAIIKLFQKEKKTALYVPAIALAATKFRDTVWTQALVDHGDEEILESALVSLIGSLPAKDRDRYALRFIKQKPQELINMLTDFDDEWSNDLAKAVLSFTSQEVYAYNKTFYRAAVKNIPVVMLKELESLMPSEEQKKAYWRNQSAELSGVLTLKQQILQSFAS